MPAVPPNADLLVVGGGPAGAAAAIIAARAGFAVTLVDKATFPRDKCCGDGLTTGALRRLEQLGLDAADVPSWQPVDEVRVTSSSGRNVLYPLPTGQGLFAAVATRADLDDALLKVARSAGVRVLEGHAVTGARPGLGSSAMVLEVEGIGELAAPYVIGADGMWSPLRKMLQPPVPPPSEPYLGEWHAYRQYFSGVDTAESRDLCVWFEPDLLPGYVWSFPLPDGRANVGFGIERTPHTPTKIMKELWPRLLERPHIASVLGPTATPEGSPKAWPIPAAIRKATLSIGRTLFVGDAARACDVLTGEGIGQALETGMAAAEAVAAGFGRGPQDVSRRYQDHVDRNMGPDDRMASWLQSAMHREWVCRGAVRLSGATGWTQRNFGRWLFEDYPRGIAITPRRWRRGTMSGPGAYRTS